MLFFLIILLSVALGATIFGTYYVQRTLSAKTDNIQIRAIADKLYKAAGIHVYYIYGAIALLGIVLAPVLYFLFSLSINSIAGFFLGIVSTIGVGHFALMFLMKLNARLADRSARGVIDAFHAVFEGGNALGVFIVGAAMLVVSVFYVSLPIDTQSSILEGFISLALGGVLASLFIKIGAAFYSKTIIENKDIFQDIGDSKNETRDPETIANLVAHNLRHGIGVLVDVFETVLLGALGAMLIAVLDSPGVSGAFILPLMILGIGFISTTISGKIIKTGSTINLTKNIFFTTLSVVVTSSLLAFPAIMWTIKEGFGFGLASLWFAVFLGLFSSSTISVLYYFYSSKKLKEGTGASMVAFFLMIGLFLSYYFVGLYGVALYVSGIIALAPLYVALSIFASVSRSVYKIVDIADLPEERKRIMQKLSFAGPVIKGSSALYFFVSSLFLSLLYFYLYQRNVSIRFPETELALADPVVFIGMFFGGIGLYAIISSMLFAHKRMETLLVGDEHEDRPIAQRKKNTSLHYAVFMKKITMHIIKASTPSALLVFLAPLAAILILGRGGFAGFVAGTMLAGGFWGIVSLLQKGESLEDSTEFSEDGVFNNSGSTIVLMISSALKAIAVFSLLSILF